MGTGLRGALLAAGLLAGPLAGVSGGCRTPGAPAAPRPGRFEARVVASWQAGPYLGARLSGRPVARAGAERSFYFPASPACRAALRPGAAVRYRPVGSFGQLRGPDGAHCDPVGLGSLTDWRPAPPAGGRPPAPPRVQAAYRKLSQTPSGPLVLRGRFPLALEMRWPEPMDAVVFLPAGPVCEAVAARGRATLEYRARGPEALVLEVPEGTCPIQGLAVPLAPGR